MLKQFLIAISIFELLIFASNGFDIKVLLLPKNIIFNLLFLFWLGMEAARVRLGHKDKNTTYGLMSRSFLIVSFVSVVIAIFDNAGSIEQVKQYKLPDIAFYIGTVLLTVGTYIRHVTIKQLGKFFVTKVQTLDDHELITSGIYSVLRHPSYTGLIVAFIGSILMLQSGLALAVFLLIGIPTYVYRINVEESALISFFGSEYSTYKKSTNAVIPFIY